jgi:tRNA G10  N-methylase Trm11
VVEQNKLISLGLEIVLIEKNSELYIGKTLAVQPFKELSFRDYGRPARDDHSGMLPPKLAQIMINLAGIKKCSGASLLDPFCGSGTILTEALLLGYKYIIGVDNSRKAIKNSEENIVWTKDNFNLANFSFDLYTRSATELSQFIKPYSIDAIITEPYLGPQRGKINLKKVVPELEKLYSQAIAEFNKVLKPNGRVVMIWPTFAKTSMIKPVFVNLKINGFQIVNPIPKSLQTSKFINLTNRKTLIYSRPGQRVWREIVLLTKAN